MKGRKGCRTEQLKLEVEDAFQTVGIMIRAKKERLCNQGRFIEAEELEKAYNVVNEHFNNALDFKVNLK